MGKVRKTAEVQKLRAERDEAQAKYRYRGRREGVVRAEGP
jgi:hypothetical protein